MEKTSADTKIAGYKNRLNEFCALMRKESKKKYAAVFVIFLVISFLLEVFVFNLNFTLSFFNREITDFDMRAVSNLRETEDGVYRVTGEKPVLELSGVDDYLHNIHLDFAVKNSEANKVVISLKDEGNMTFYSFPERVYLEKIKRSHYIRLNPAGKVNAVRLEIDAGSGSEIKINDIGLNVHVPLMFSISRFLFVWLIMCVLFLLRPKSFVYRYKVNFKSVRQRVLLCVLVAAQIAAFWNLVNLNPFFKDPTRHYYEQYHELTESLLSGHTYLIQHEVSDTLKNLKNPYDLNERYDALSEDNGGKPWDNEWDHAYYNEKIYVYFGVAPVILLYLPFYALTGKHLPDHIVIFINSLFLIFAVLLLLYQIIKRWFKNTPLALYLLMSCLVINSCGIVYALQRPDLYSVPVTMSAMFGILGIGLWMASIKSDPDNSENKKISVPLIALGSFCVAATAGCRPQSLLIIALGFVIFWRSVFKDRLLFSKSGLKQTIALCLPFAVIAAALMCYNAARFGSPFDFGANYNLTSNDMRYRGFRFDRIFSSIFYYMFSPVGVSAVFPFIKMTSVEVAYQGRTIAENVYSLFSSNPIAWFSLAVFPLRRRFKSKDLFAFTVTALVVGAVIAVLDANVAGILSRYLTDFSWLIFAAAAIMVFMIYECVKTESIRRAYVSAVLICCVLGLSFHGLRIFTDISDNLSDLIPVWYYNMQHLIAFWL